jgi:hypothetical protein
MVKMKTEKSRLVQEISRDRDGAYVGCLLVTDDTAATCAKEWGADLAAHIKFFQMKQGWTKLTCGKLVDKFFGTL